jgi:hypothetical protein
MMIASPTVDGALVQWGERLFYPPNRIVRNPPTPRLDTLMRRKAAVIRGRIVATVSRRAPQVMVKVTGGGRGMVAIAAHLRYVSKNGRLEMEDDRGVTHKGKEAMHDLADMWRQGGALIPDKGSRREAFNIMLSMPHGTDPGIVQRAAREFAATELAGHRYVMVLHDHQANPHVHLSVRAAARDGSRLNPRKSDLHRWRETFAERLRGWGVKAEATRQPTRGENRRFDPLWRLQARQEGRLPAAAQPAAKSGEAYKESRRHAVVAWVRIGEALLRSDNADDRALAHDIARFLRDTPFVRELDREHPRDVVKLARDIVRPTPTMQRPGPDIER